MTEPVQWAVVIPPVNGVGGGAWGPFESQDAAKRWKDQQIDHGGSNSTDFYKNGHVLRLDNPA